MRFRLLALLGLAMVVCLTSAVVAQDEQRGRGRGRGGPGGPGGGFGGFGGFRGMGGGMDIGPAIPLMGMLQMPEVREEVGMSDEIWEAIPEDAKRMDRETMQGMRDASPEEREKAFAEFNEKAQQTLEEVLEPEKLKRLMGLLAQRDGISSVTNALIAKEIGLGESDLEKVKQASDKAREEMGEQMRELFAGMRGRGDRGDDEGGRGRGGFDREAMEKMRAKMEELREKSEASIADALSSEQKQKFEDLKGEKFEFPEARGFGGRGGPPGAFGRGGRGGPGGRGGRPGGGNRPSGSDNDN